MHRARPARLANITGIGVDRMGSIGDASNRDLLRLENLDCNIPPDSAAIVRTQDSATEDNANSYLPFIGQLRLREVVAEHVSSMSGIKYSGQRNCLISAGGLSGILNVLLATVDVGDEVIVTDPTYAGLINRVRLAGGVAKLVPYHFSPGSEWKLDIASLKASVTSKTRAMLLMSPSMPTGAFFTTEDWIVIAELCVANDLILILDTAMERIVFDNRKVIHPAGLPGMQDRTITVGSASKELRMIGWRVGWIVAPESFIPDLTAVSLANVVVPVGIAQDAAATALSDSNSTMHPYVQELETRRNVLLAELDGLPHGIPAGGWSLLLKVSDFGIDGEEASKRLLEQGVCATSMRGWGETHGAQYVRFVFANETSTRLQGLGLKVRKALGIK